LTLQPFCNPHAGHEPPQSLSVSVPFFTPSEHVGAAQTLFVQTPLVQSGPSAQPFPTSHLVAHEPPQSTSVSVPFFAPSVHEGASQTCVAMLQFFVVQSLPTRQR